MQITEEKQAETIGTIKLARTVANLLQQTYLSSVNVLMHEHD